MYHEKFLSRFFSIASTKECETEDARPRHGVLTVILEKLFDQVNVSQDHAPAAVPFESKISQNAPMRASRSVMLISIYYEERRRRRTLHCLLVLQTTA